MSLSHTLFPSMSKCVKLTVIRHCGGAKISQIQFLLAGYKSGNEGDVMVPLDVSISPPHASEQRKFSFLYLKMILKNLTLRACLTFR